MIINPIIHVPPPINVSGTQHKGGRDSDTYETKRSGRSR